MSDTYQIVFLKAGDGSPSAKRAVAEKIANATKAPTEQILKQIEKAPFIYKKGLPRAKADNIAATLQKMGAVTEVRAEAESAAAPGVPGPAPKAPGGFDFGAPPPSPSGAGFDFGTPSAPAGSSGSIPSGGFSLDFGAAAPAKSEDFPIEEPSGGFSPIKPASAPAASSGFGGFSFTPEAATAAPSQKQPESQVAVSRNLDYAEDSGKARSDAPPPKAPSKKKAQTVTCPRCQQEVPPANECGNCGVVMAKAGEGAHAAPARKPRAPVAPKKSPLIYVGIAVALVGGLAALFFGGALNPIRLKMDIGNNSLLRQYGVQIEPPKGRYAAGTLADAGRAQEIQMGFLERSKSVEAEIARLSALSSLEEFERGEHALDTEIGEYTRHAGNLVLDEIRKVAAPYYRIQGSALVLGGAIYMFPETIELTGSRDNPQVIAILSDADIKARLKAGREQVAASETRRLADEHARSVDVSFEDGFDGALNDRWQKPATTLNASGGRLKITARPVAPAQAPRLMAPEPNVDYIAKVTVAGSGGDGARGGLLVESPSGFLAVVRARGAGGDVVTFAGSSATRATSMSVSRETQVKVERVAGEYVLSVWNGAKGVWSEVGRESPSWVAEPGRRIGLAAFGGSSPFEFDDFSLAIKP